LGGVFSLGLGLIFCQDVSRVTRDIEERSDGEETPRRSLNKKDFQARIDRLIAHEERTFGQLLELRDRVDAIVAELDRSAHDPVAALPNISKIIATPSQFPWRLPRRLP
jgi:hypothetical protein